MLEQHCTFIWSLGLWKDARRNARCDAVYLNTQEVVMVVSLWIWDVKWKLLSTGSCKSNCSDGEDKGNGGVPCRTTRTTFNNQGARWDGRDGDKTQKETSSLRTTRQMLECPCKSDECGVCAPHFSSFCSWLVPPPNPHTIEVLLACRCLPLHRQ